MKYADRYADRIKAGVDAVLAAYGKPASQPEPNPNVDRGPSREGEPTVEDFYVWRTIHRAGLL